MTDHSRSPDLILLDSARQIDVLCDDHPRHLERSKLVALSLRAAEALNLRNCEFIAAWDYLEPHEHLAIAEQAETLIGSWTAAFSPLCRYKGADIPAWDTETVRFFLYDGLFLKTALPRLFADASARSIAIPGAITRPAMFYLDSDANAAVSAYLALAHDLHVDMLPPEKGWPSGERFMPVADEKAMDRALRSAAEERRGRPMVVLNSHGLRGVVFLAETLHEAGFFVVVLALGSLSSGEREALAGSAMVIDVGVFWQGPVPDQYRKHFEAARAACRSWTEHYDGEHPELFGNPLLAYQFDYYLGYCWPSAAWLLDVVEEVLARLSPDCLITSDLSDPEVRMSLHAATRLGVPKIVGLHGGWPRGPDVYPVADRVMLWGQSQRAFAEAHWQGRWAVVGPLAGPDDRRGPDPDALDAARRRLKLSPDRATVLVMNGSTATGAFPRCPLGDHLRSLSNLLRVPEELAGRIHILVKKKPGFEESWLYDEALRRIGNRDHVTLVDDIPLELLTGLCDVAVMVTMTTTAYLEPIFSNAPLLWIQTVPLFRNHFAHLPEPGVQKIETDDQVWPTLAPLLFDRKHRENLAARQRAFWENDMPLDRAAGCVLQVVREVIDQPARRFPAIEPVVGSAETTA